MLRIRKWLWLVVLFTFSGVGCAPLSQHQLDHLTTEQLGPLHAGPPRELSKAVLPTYRVEPPDILVVEALNANPREPYTLRPLDVVSIYVPGALADAPINNIYRVERQGVILLGPPYGTVRVAGNTVEAAQQAVLDHVKKTLRDPGEVTLTLVEIAGVQEISGEHLVAQDGTITLGSYGSVPVVGLSLAEAKWTIEDHLSAHFKDPEVSVDVFAYNSKVYYVITQGAGLGDGVFRFPVTGNETVLDALAQINGFQQTGSCKIWVARPGPDNRGRHDILPVDWQGITKYGDVTTNFQLMPGDRVYVAEDKWVALDTKIAKITAPFERLFGFITLGTDTVTRLSGPVLQGGGDRRFQGN